MSGDPYSKVYRRVWNDAKFRGLSGPPPNAQTLFFRLLTGPELTNVPGLIAAGEASLAESLEWPLKGFRKAFAEVASKGFAEADWKARLVWVPNAIRKNEPASPNVIKSWTLAWNMAPECALKLRAWEHLRAYAEAKGEAWLVAFDKACAKPFKKALPEGLPKAFQEGFGEGTEKPSPNQEQEQDQEACFARNARVREAGPSLSPGAPPSAERLPGDPGSPLGLRAALRRGYAERYLDEAKREPSHARLSSPKWDQVCAELERRCPGEAPAAVAKRALDAFFACPVARRLTWPVGQLATGIDAYALGEPAERERSSPRGNRGMRPQSPLSEFKPDGDSDEEIARMFAPEAPNA